MNLMPKTILESWEAFFEDVKDDLSDIEKVIGKDMKNKGYTRFYPDPENLYRPFELCRLENVKVVILSDKPYADPCDCGKHCRADGLAWSVKDCDIIPGPLKNILQESNRNNGNLESWGRQGILLLNACLTCPPGKPNGHGSIWHGFVSKVFRAIDSKNKKCIYLLWGREVKELMSYMTDSAIKLETMNPPNWSSFLGNGHFKQVNNLLKEPINWPE